MPLVTHQFNFCVVFEDPLGRRACPLQYVVRANSMAHAEEKLGEWLQENYGNTNTKWEVLPATYID